MRRKYLWFSDTHLEKVSSWDKGRFLYKLSNESPAGIFLTGDISNGLKICFHLRMISAIANCPVYFVLGNHDYHFSSIDKIHDKIHNLCEKNPNLVWLPENGPIKLSKKAAVIGVDGWYDAENGNPDFLKFTPDWFLIKDFRKLPSMDARIEMWRKIARASADSAEKKLVEAINSGYKRIYLLTHVSPWKEATRDVGTFLERFWLPYNTNLTLGRKLKEVMSNHNKKRLTVLSGHTHEQSIIWVRRNVQCIVNDSNYLSGPQIRNIIYV